MVLNGKATSSVPLVTGVIGFWLVAFYGIFMGAKGCGPECPIPTGYYKGESYGGTYEVHRTDSNSKHTTVDFIFTTPKRGSYHCRAYFYPQPVVKEYRSEEDDLCIKNLLHHIGENPFVLDIWLSASGHNCTSFVLDLPRYSVPLHLTSPMSTSPPKRNRNDRSQPIILTSATIGGQVEHPRGGLAPRA